MITTIKTIHTETDKLGEEIGLLLNKEINDTWSDTFLYIFKDDTYTFFETIEDMFKYRLGEINLKRAYLNETNFDMLYDEEIKGKFENYLEWV